MMSFRQRLIDSVMPLHCKYSFQSLPGQVQIPKTAREMLRELRDTNAQFSKISIVPYRTLARGLRHVGSLQLGVCYDKFVPIDEKIALAREQ
jgi:hypothetical protein